MYKYFNEKQDPEMKGISDLLMQMLDKAREKAGVPFIITSGLRSIEKNKTVGGVSNSAHLKGLAVDLRCTDSKNRLCILNGLISAGFRRIELCKSHIHADIDFSKEQDVLILG